MSRNMHSSVTWKTGSVGSDMSQHIHPPIPSRETKTYKLPRARDNRNTPKTDEKSHEQNGEK